MQPNNTQKVALINCKTHSKTYAKREDRQSLV